MINIVTISNLFDSTWSWSYKQDLSINLRYTQFTALILVEILEQPIRMLKNKWSVILQNRPYLSVTRPLQN